MTRKWAVLVVAAMALSPMTACGGGPERGPMTRRPPHGWAITKPVGATFTDGFDVLRLRGQKPAVLDSVELVGAEGMELVGFRLGGPGRKQGAVQLMDNDRFPRDKGTCGWPS